VNRPLTSLGAALLAVGIVLVVPVFTDPTLLPLGLLPLGATFLIAVGFVVLLFAVTRPDPETTTVGGLFGSREENLLQRQRAGEAAPPDRRYRPAPRESVNCVACYTVIPSQVLSCPRCGRARRCESCGRPLYELAGAVRCAPCVKDELYCSCPPLPRRAGGLAARRALG
jgi:hypothetical protein